MASGEQTQQLKRTGFSVPRRGPRGLFHLWVAGHGIALLEIHSLACEKHVCYIRRGGEGRTKSATLQREFGCPAGVLRSPGRESRVAETLGAEEGPAGAEREGEGPAGGGPRAPRAPHTVLAVPGRQGPDCSVI